MADSSGSELQGQAAVASVLMVTGDRSGEQRPLPYNEERQGIPFAMVYPVQPRITREILSGSTNGRAVKVAATATAGTLIHTSVASTTRVDEIWLWAINTDSTARKLTLEFGGVTAPDDLIELTIQPESGLVLVVQGLVLQNGLILRAFAATANVICLHGFVNRIGT